MSKKDTENFILDISNEVCPITFVKVKILLEKMSTGSVAKILVKKGEALKNVPKSIEEDGHSILKKTKRENNNYLLLVKKKQTIDFPNF